MEKKKKGSAKKEKVEEEPVVNFGTQKHSN